MQVSVSNTGTLERRITVEVPEDHINKEVQSRLQAITRTARIDGFRPGKAPMRLVEQRYASRVRDEVVGEVVRRSFADAVTQEKLRPAGAPVIDPLTAEPGKGLSYTATFEVYPEVTMKPVTELKLNQTKCEITEADIDKMIAKLREQRRAWKKVERNAATGDRVTIDFVGKVDGAPFPGGTAQDYQLELGAGRFIPGFEEGLVGKAPGSHEIPVTFPNDYPHQELAGKAAVFEITLKQVEEPALPELNEEFFKAFGVDEGGIEAFRADVRRNVERERDQALRTRLKHGTFNALIEANPLELPKALVENEARRLLHQSQQGLMMRGIPRSQVEGMSADSFRQQAERRVALGLLLGDIIQKQKLEADPVRVRNLLEQMASTYDDPAAVIKWYYEDDERLNEVRTAVLEDQVVDWLMSQAKVTEQSISFDDLMNPRQTEIDAKAQV
jgi:trigger factor